MSDDPNQVRRGLLIGTFKGNAIEGTFIIASNGGTALIDGTWSAEL
jgi:hypothetical protein